jgi:hypothetical protein
MLRRIDGVTSVNRDPQKALAVGGPGRRRQQWYGDNHDDLGGRTDQDRVSEQKVRATILSL